MQTTEQRYTIAIYIDRYELDFRVVNVKLHIACDALRSYFFHIMKGVDIDESTKFRIEHNNDVKLIIENIALLLVEKKYDMRFVVVVTSDNKLKLLCDITQY